MSSKSSFTGIVLLVCIASAVVAVSTSSELMSEGSDDEPPSSGSIIIKCEKNDSRLLCYHDGTHYDLTSSESKVDEKLSTSTILIYVGIIGCLVLFAGLMSGLTIGLMSLTTMDLQIMLNAGTPSEKKYAAILLPLINKQHLLLVTLLVANAAAMEALPIFLDRLTDPIAAIAISVSLVLMFGEVIPQALCKRYALPIGAYTAWFVKILMVLLFVIAWPVSKLLDLVLGTAHEHYFERSELKELVTIHSEEKHGPLTIDECTIIKGALDMKNKKVTACMTPLDSVFMLPADLILNKETLNMIYESGHSRIPIYKDSKQNIIGLLFVKRLITLDSTADIALSQLVLPPLITVPSSKELYEMLNEFQTGKSHMVGIYDAYTKVILGIVTLEDIIEELIQEEIIDETDVYIDVSKKVRVAKAIRQLAVTPKLGSKNAAARSARSGRGAPLVIGESTALLSTNV